MGTWPKGEDAQLQVRHAGRGSAALQRASGDVRVHHCVADALLRRGGRVRRITRSTDVPDGSYTVTAWREGMKPQSKPVAVSRRGYGGFRAHQVIAPRRARLMRTRFRNKKVDSDWLNTNFPCMMACPAQTNAGRYVSLIAEGKIRGSLSLCARSQPDGQHLRPCLRAPLRDRLPAGRHRQTDLHPRAEAFSYRTARARVAAPVEAPALQRTEKLPYRVAIIGSGPVGLSAAHDLALMGYSVTIFEAAPVAGGMLCLGIPGVSPSAQRGGSAGPRNPGVGRHHSEAQSRGRDATSPSPVCASEGFDAVVIAVGAHRSRDLSIPGIELDGVLKGIDFLLNSNLGYRFSIGKRVVVIGGGNVAMDVARSAAREVLAPARGQFSGSGAHPRKTSRPWPRTK